MNDVRTKAAVSVTDMCKMLSLSRARFYQLVERGVFHQPVYSLATKRPFFTLDQQQDNLAVRETNIGVNGEFVLFYGARGQTTPAAQPLHPRAKPAAEEHRELLEGLRSLGLTLTPQQVSKAVSELFPRGVERVDEALVLRTVYRHLRQSGGG